MTYVTKNHPRLSTIHQCRLLGLNRSGLYYQAVRPCREMITLMNEIRDIHETYPMYGYRKVYAVLRRQGWQVNRKRVERLWTEMGLCALYAKKRTTLQDKQGRRYPYLLKDLSMTKPNQVWQTDITYIKLAGGYVYLIALIDVYSRYVRGWTLSNTMDTSFCLRAFDQATELGVYPEILNTDQGSQFTSDEWLYACVNCGVQISMTGKGRCADNIFVERFWRTLKYEEVYLKSYDTIRDARRAIGKFIDFYNHERPHQGLNYQTPADCYLGISGPSTQPDGDGDNIDLAIELPTSPQATTATFVASFN